LRRKQLCNAGLEQVFFGLWGVSVGDTAVTLPSAFAAHSCVALQSFSDLSLLSADALDGCCRVIHLWLTSKTFSCELCCQFWVHFFFAIPFAVGERDN
jgi:hypothetical protein